MSETKFEKELYEAGISQIDDWLSKKGWTMDVSYTNRDECEPATRTIFVNGRQGVEKQFYSLLHECGHLLIQQNSSQYEKQYPFTAKMNTYATFHKQLEKTAKYKVDVISEEIEAWKRGKTLSDRLGLYINEEKYNTLAAECVYSYVEWAAKIKK